MKISYNWLKDYINISVLPENLARELTLKCFEVEEVKHCAGVLSDIVVGEIMEIRKHPNADRLHVTKINIGARKPLIIVCGGANISVGQKVPVALLGAKLANGTVIREAKIRSIESEGMLCSAEELGFMPEGERCIMILDKNTKIGTSVIKVLGLNDWIFEISVPANRGDLQSHKGVAREIAALLGKKIHLTTYAIPKPPKNKFGNIRIETNSAKDCKMFASLVIDKISIQPSPQWLQNRLRNIGIRSINYLVDVTNYIMADTGQPLHAFDYHKIAGLNTKKLIIRSAKEGETVQTLDSKVRELQPGMLIIEDGEKIIDLAGIMGGGNSAIDKKTTTIVLQAAIFDPVCVRKTSRALGFRTNAVAYFEKGIDPALPLEALSEAYHLMKEINPEICILNIAHMHHDKLKRKFISFTIESVKRLGGIEIDAKSIRKILVSLGMVVKVQKNNQWSIDIPSWRLDIEHEQDIIEEILRMHGYSNLQVGLPATQLKEYPIDQWIPAVSRIKDILISKGCFEVINYSFANDRSMNKLKSTRKYLKIQNPLNKEQKYLRTELESGLLGNVCENLKYQDSIKIFEIGKVFFDSSEGIKEIYKSQGIVASKKLEHEKELFWESREMAEQVIHNFFEEEIEFRIVQCKNYCAEICIQNEVFAKVEIIDKRILDAFDITGSAALFELKLDRIIKYANNERVFKSLPIYPPVKLDIACVVEKKFHVQDIIRDIKKFGRPILADVTLFDVFSSWKIGKQKQSLAFHLYYNDPQKTMTLDSVKKFHQEIISQLKKKYHIILR